MRHVLDRSRAALAISAATALLMAGCAPDDDGDVAEPETDDQEVALPAGVFGEECQQILASAELEDATGLDVEAETDVDADADADADAETDLEGDAGVENASLDDDLDADDGLEGEAGAEGDAEGELDTDAETDGDTETETDADTDIDTEADVEVDERVAQADTEDRLSEMTLLDALDALPELSEFNELLQTSALVTDLEDADDLTVFVPSNTALGENGTDDDATEGTDEDAIDGTDDGVETDAATGTGFDIEDLEVDTETLLAYHIHDQQRLLAQDLVDEETLRTLDGDVVDDDVEGEVGTDADDNGVDADDEGVAGGDHEAGQLRITAEGEVITVEADESTATVVCANIETADAIIHVVDEVLIPDAAAADTDTTTDTTTDAGTDAETDVEADVDADTDADADADAGADADGFDGNGDVDEDDLG